MRTRIGEDVGQGSSARRACACSAARTAWDARANAPPNASPAVEKTHPPDDSIAERMISSWRRSAAAIASLSAAHRRVDPSMSVKRNVTVPVGNLPSPATPPSPFGEG
jgi:hypothetical protein